MTLADVVGLAPNEILDLVTYLGFAATAAALGFSIWQVRQALSQAQEFKAISATAENTLERLGDVSEALSTRVLGDWPGYLSELARFVSETQSYLKIVRDVPSCGIFSNLEGHQEYQSALEDSLGRGNKLSIVFMSADRRRRLNDDFAPATAKQWSDEFRQLVVGWVTRLSRFDPTTPVPATYDEYLDLLEYTNVRALQRLANAASVGSDRAGRKLYEHRETDAMFPLYIWVRDGIEAVFAVAVFSPEAEKEIAFFTRDPGLVAALEAAFDRYVTTDGVCTVDLAPEWPAMARVSGPTPSPEPR